jgi:TetR/AcrR family transcriptional regulator, regulator of cefoperazone and chloramphenicol sensitivity
MDQAEDSRERVLAAATRLFAERGFDGTTTREIGRASGLNIATVAYHLGAKADLYREVMRRAYQEELAALTGAVSEFEAAAIDPDSGLAAARRLVRRYLDFCLARPEVPALWMRRWLADAAEIGEPEAEYAWPLAVLVRAAFRDKAHLFAHGVDTEMALWTVAWSVHAFCVGGIPEADGKRHGGADLAIVERYRAHLDALVTSLLAVKR